MRRTISSCPACPRSGRRAPSGRPPGAARRARGCRYGREGTAWASVGCGRLEIKILARFPGRGTSSRRRAGLGAHDAEDAADDHEDGVKEAPDVQDEDQDANDDRQEPARAHPALVDEQAAEERGDPEDDADGFQGELIEGHVPPDSAQRTREDEDSADEGEEESEDREESFLRHGGRVGVAVISPFPVGYPFSSPASAKIPWGRPWYASRPRYIRRVRNAVSRRSSPAIRT